MTDEEILCEFMEPRKVYGKWWNCGTTYQETGDPVFFKDSHKPLRQTVLMTNLPVAIRPDLNALHEIEARLTQPQWYHYRDALCRIWQRLDKVPDLQQFCIHADAPIKVKALASVLREIVGGG